MEVAVKNMRVAPPSPAMARRSLAPKFLAFSVVSFVLPAVMLFGAAGRLDWLWGWVVIGISVGFGIGARLVMLMVDPDVLIERGRSLDADNVKPWDRLLMPIVGLLLPFAMLIVAGLDQRFGLSPQLAPGLRVTALVVLILSMVLGTWALFANRFFSGTVRIQTERGHSVVSSGPYRFIRHPGYVGAILMYLATPLVLGTLWGLLPAALILIGILIRTALEDKMLHEELPGYREYAARTRYRLIPGVW
jgi:protein-S-isoprenylcysteine O-methyltransferase Ste14